MATDPGEYRHRVIVQCPTKSRDVAGQNVQSWQDEKTRSAKINPLRGQALALAQAKTACQTVTHEIRMRWFLGLKPGRHRLKFGCRIFAINAAIDPEELRIEWVLTCTELTA